MNLYTVENTVSGAILGYYLSETPEGALDALAADAGYRDHAHACDVTGSDGSSLRVTESACEDPAELARDDATDAYNNWLDDAGTATDRDGAVLRYAGRIRAGSAPPPSDGMLNAMGRAYVLRQAGVPGSAGDSDLAWETAGRQWCRLYDDAYAVQLEFLAAGAP